MTEQDFLKASEIMAELESLRNEFQVLSHFAESAMACKEINCIKRMLVKIKDSFVAYEPRIQYDKDYGSPQLICELSEDDLLALVEIRGNKVAALEEELQKLGRVEE